MKMNLVINMTHISGCGTA